jgi:hypothetical protein
VIGLAVIGLLAVVGAAVGAWAAGLGPFGSSSSSGSGAGGEVVEAGSNGPDGVYLAWGSDPVALAKPVLEKPDKTWTWRPTNDIGLMTVADGTAYVVDQPAYNAAGQVSVAAIDVTSGEERWTARLGSKASTYPTLRVIDDVLIVSGSYKNDGGSDSTPNLGHVWAFQTSDGKPLWEFDLEGDATTAMKTKGGVALQGLVSGGDSSSTVELVVVDLKSGQKRWGDTYQSASVYVADDAIAVTQKDTIDLLDPESGSARWTADVVGVYSPFIAGDQVLAFAYDDAGTLVSLSLSSGKEQWSADSNGGEFSAAVLDDRMLAVSTMEGAEVVSRKDGSEIWTSGSLSPQGAVKMGGKWYLYATDSNTQGSTELVLVDPMTGREAGSFKIRQSIDQSVLADKVVYSIDNGVISAYDFSDDATTIGTKLWEYETANAQSTSSYVQIRPIDGGLLVADESGLHRLGS